MGRLPSSVGGERGAYVGSVHLQQRGLAGHGHLGGFALHAKRNIDSSGRVDLDFGSGFKGRKSGRGHRHLVSAREQVSLLVIAALIGLDLGRRAAVQVGDLHIDIGHSRAAFIRHGAEDVAVYRLSHGQLAEQTK